MILVYIVLPDKTVHLPKKSNSILHLQTTMSFQTKHIQSELCNKLFTGSHVSLLFEKDNSIETNISSLFRLNRTKMLIKTKQHFPCLHRSKLVYDFIKPSFCCFLPFYSHQSYIT